jgi:hypothetical protein
VKNGEDLFWYWIRRQAMEFLTAAKTDMLVTLNDKHPGVLLWRSIKSGLLGGLSITEMQALHPEDYQVLLFLMREDVPVDTGGPKMSEEEVAIADFLKAQSLAPN